MIVIRLKGGLGNQLFQYAAARRLAILRNTEVKIELGVSISDARPDRPIWLDKFRAPISLATPDDIDRLRNRYVREPRFAYFPGLLQMQDDVILEGYWQSERYFADVAPVIRQDLAFRNPDLAHNARAAIAELKAKRGGGDVVAVHVRRGDYNWPAHRPMFHELSLDWYRRAMARFPEGTSFLVFSDDIPWCRENLAGERVGFATSGKVLVDFALMRCCDHYIVANSTFSWWGAYLSENPDPRVFAPDGDAWFGEVRRDNETAHLLPPRWVALPD